MSKPIERGTWLALAAMGVAVFVLANHCLCRVAAEPRRRDHLHVFQIGGGSVGLGLTTTIFIGASNRATGGPDFINGIQTAFGVDAAIAFSGFLLATFLIGGRPRLPLAIHRLHAGPSPRGHGP